MANTFVPPVFPTDGVVVGIVPPAPVGAPNISASLSGHVGTANRGKTNTPIYSNNPASAQAGLGSNTLDAHALLTQLLSGYPESANDVSIRVTDSTDTAAQLPIVDTAGPPALTLVDLTAIETGDYFNSATYQLDLVQGTLAAGPVLRLQVFPPNGAPAEVWDGIVAYAAAGGAFDPPTFKTNTIAAVNGTAPNTVASAYWIASSGASAGNPATGVRNGVATLGTNGNTGVTSAMLLGQDVTAGRTGLYALRGLGCAQVAIAGNTDRTLDGALSQFAQTERCIAVTTFAANTSVSSAISAKATASAYLAYVKDWLYWYDTIAGQKRLIPPVGKVLGLMSSLLPEQYVGNQFEGQGVSGVLGSDKGGLYYTGDAAQLKSNGIMYFTNPAPGGNYWALAHGLNSLGTVSGNNAQNTCNWTRMTNWLANSLQMLGGQFIGRLQSTDANDDTRREARGKINAFMNGLITPNRRINTFADVLDNSNNTPQTIGLGLLIGAVTVAYLDAIQNFYIGLQGGSLNVVSLPVTNP